MRIRVATTLFALLLCALPAWSQQITLSTQLDYQLSDQRLRDPDKRITQSGFLPRVNLSLTGLTRPGSRLYLDLTGGLWRNNFDGTSQSDDNMRLVLRGEDPRRRLSLWYGKSRFSASTDGVDLTPSRLVSNAQETGLTLMLREPAWPVLNLQYSRFAADSGLSGSTSHTDTTTSRVNALYDLAPLRLRFDQTQYSSGVLGGASTDSTARRLGVSMDAALLPKLSLFGDLQLSRVENQTGSVLGGSNNRTASFRLTGEVTPKVALDAEVHSLLNSTLGNVTSGDLSGNGASVSMRSEVTPGVQLNASHFLNHAGRRGLSTDSAASYLDIVAQLDSRNTALISLAPSRFSSSQAPTVTQNSQRVSWTSQLDAQTDLSVTLDRTGERGGGFDLDETSRFLTFRYRPDLQTTLGLGLLWDTSRLPGADGAPTNQTTRGLDAEVSWLPASTLSVGGHLSLTQTTGLNAARLSVPAFDLRWQPDSRSSLTLNWRAQRALSYPVPDQADRLDLATLGATFRYQLSRDTTLNVDYGRLALSEGPLASDRELRITITTGVGR